MKQVTLELDLWDDKIKIVGDLLDGTETPFKEPEEPMDVVSNQRGITFIGPRNKSKDQDTVQLMSLTLEVGNTQPPKGYALVHEANFDLLTPRLLISGSPALQVMGVELDRAGAMRALLAASSLGDMWLGLPDATGIIPGNERGVDLLIESIKSVSRHQKAHRVVDNHQMFEPSGFLGKKVLLKKLAASDVVDNITLEKFSDAAISGMVFYHTQWGHLGQDWVGEAEVRGLKRPLDHKQRFVKVARKYADYDNCHVGIHLTATGIVYYAILDAEDNVLYCDVFDSGWREPVRQGRISKFFRDEKHQINRGPFGSIGLTPTLEESRRSEAWILSLKDGHLRHEAEVHHLLDQTSSPPLPPFMSRITRITWGVAVFLGIAGIVMGNTQLSQGGMSVLFVLVIWFFVSKWIQRFRLRKGTVVRRVKSPEDRELVYKLTLLYAGIDYVTENVPTSLQQQTWDFITKSKNAKSREALNQELDWWLWHAAAGFRVMDIRCVDA